MSKWTFLTNHSHVLLCLVRTPEATMREVADLVGITERAVQRIVADLEEAGYLKRRRVGRRNTYRVARRRPLRHPIECHRQVSALIELVEAVDAGGEPGPCRQALSVEPDGEPSLLELPLERLSRRLVLGRVREEDVDRHFSHSAPLRRAMVAISQAGRRQGPAVRCDTLDEVGPSGT